MSIREINRALWPETISKKTFHGFKRAHNRGLVINGATAPDKAFRYSAGERGDTLQAVRGHRFAYALDDPGELDLTAHVDFAALAKATRSGGARPSRVSSQGTWLETLGIGAPTCSLSDFIGTDLLVVFGSDLPNNQPVTTKYMHYAKEKGTRIVVVNPMREYGLERYWVPSVARSALFGTKLADDFFTVHTGGDLAFLTGALKHLIEQDWLDHRFIEQHDAVCGVAQPDQGLAATKPAERHQIRVAEAVADFSRSAEGGVRAGGVPLREASQAGRQQQVALFDAVTTVNFQESPRPGEPSGGLTSVAAKKEM